MFYLNGNRLNSILEKCKDEEHQQKIFSVFVKVWCLENVYDETDSANKEESLAKVELAEQWVKEIEGLPLRKTRLVCLSMAKNLETAKDIYNWLTKESLDGLCEDWFW